jgi:hypothetical protein
LAISDQVSRPTAWQRHGAQIFYPQEVPENLLALIEADCQQGLFGDFDTVAWGARFSGPKQGNPPWLSPCVESDEKRAISMLARMLLAR